MKNALLIAYHFPPVKVSSGLQRTLSFVRDLRTHGWAADVLTAHPRAYETTSEDQMQDIPPETEVIRAFALDTARHLALGGRYSRYMALPDRWVSWWLGGVFAGLKAIRRKRPAVLWSTYPIATAHLVALTLHRLTGIPWVADFRDSMTEEDYPADATQRKLYRWIERRTISACSRAVFTTPGAVDMYRARYPLVPSERWQLIPNGYNEDIFQEVEQEVGQNAQLRQTVQSKLDDSTGSRVTLLHSGVIYPGERDPRHFFEALGALKERGVISHESLRVILRAPGHEPLYQPQLDDLDIADVVKLEPGLPYREALREMMSVDGLLILQGSSCNHQVPAKLYEYFRAGRPVLGLTDSSGDTARVMQSAGLNSIAPLNDSGAIQQELQRFLDNLRLGTETGLSPDAARVYSRSAAAQALADVLEAL